MGDEGLEESEVMSPIEWISISQSDLQIKFLNSSEYEDAGDT